MRYEVISLQVYLEAALLYDAVYLYALALEKSLREGVDPEDGYNISQRLFNMTFMGKITSRLRNYFGIEYCRETLFITSGLYYGGVSYAPFHSPIFKL